jgi:hypothetical protein
MGMPVVRPFHALAGDEVAKIILEDIKRNLENDFRFKRNLTYPQVAFRWKIAIDAYPTEPSQFSVESDVKVLKAPGLTELPQDAVSVEINLEGEKTVAAPISGATADAARREAGIAVPAPRSVKGPGGQRVIVDAPQVDHTALGRPSVSSGEANVEKGGKVFARSVVQRTKAAPEGTEVLPQAGVRPTVEDVQEILDRDNKEE